MEISSDETENTSSRPNNSRNQTTNTILYRKMLGNISDCVKKIFLYFTASLIKAWISIRIIYTKVYFISMNTSPSDLNESSKLIKQKLIYVCSFNFMYIVLVLVFRKWISQSDTNFGEFINTYLLWSSLRKQLTVFVKSPILDICPESAYLIYNSW